MQEAGVGGRRQALRTTSFNGRCAACGTVYRYDPAGNTVEVMHYFNREDHNGITPMSGLVKDGTGRFYGTTRWTYSDGHNALHGWGTVYRITP